MNLIGMCLGVVGGILISSSVSANEAWTCLNGSDGVEAFQSGDMKRASNYTESENGGARVQREHPDTYMFAQAKFIRGEKRNAAICQYSNHVGLVATYLILDVETVKSLDGCESSKCHKRAHWRREWSESQNEGPRGQDRMFVCMQTVDNLKRPSSECEFTGFK